MLHLYRLAGNNTNIVIAKDSIIAEIVYVQNSWSTSIEYVFVEGYLSHRWDIPLNDKLHRFYKRPPLKQEYENQQQPLQTFNLILSDESPDLDTLLKLDVSTINSGDLSQEQQQKIINIVENDIITARQLGYHWSRLLRVIMEQLPSSFTLVPVLNNDNIHQAVLNYLMDDTAVYGPIEHWDIRFVTDMSNLFYNKHYYKNGDYSDDDIDRVFTAFNRDITLWDISAVTHFDSMFRQATWFWTTKQPDVSYRHMFDGATAFKHALQLRTLTNNTSRVLPYYFENMFRDSAGSLQWDGNNIIKLLDDSTIHPAVALVFSKPSGVAPQYWDTSNVTDMSYLFWGLTIDNEVWEVVDWDTSNVTNMSYMFSNCLFSKGDISGWDVSKVTNMERMFERSSVAVQSR